MSSHRPKRRNLYILLELESEMDIFLMNLIIQITQYICKLYIIHKYVPSNFYLEYVSQYQHVVTGFF